MKYSMIVMAIFNGSLYGMDNNTTHFLSSNQVQAPHNRDTIIEIDPTPNQTVLENNRSLLVHNLSLLPFWNDNTNTQEIEQWINKQTPNHLTQLGSFINKKVTQYKEQKKESDFTPCNTHVPLLHKEDVQTLAAKFLYISIQDTIENNEESREHLLERIEDNTYGIKNNKSNFNCFAGGVFLLFFLQCISQYALITH